MTTRTQSESPILEFLTSFLQEKNIKWVLATGMLILLGSSLMMVMPNWDDFAPTWKFVTIAAYTGLVFAAGWSSYHKLSLRKTGTGLLALTVLMVPVSCMAWHLVWAASDSMPRQLGSVLLLVVHATIATWISRNTFRHFLRGNQPTFVATYLILSLAGGIAPVIREAGAIASWLCVVGLWGVFSLGVVKVNRHVFWLTEEHRKPRILGFFPIVLLGGQFLAIFAANFSRSMSVDWIGFGCVLVAIPVLLTADTVAKVFQMRTGNLVRPIPWPIMLPFTVGILLCMIGVGLAAAMVVHRAPYAVVPAAALAAALMAVTARRTNHSAFVWAMLLGIMIAYNFSPVFFQSLARAAVSQGAAAVHESRLPFAFYGLTYLPLILTTASVATLLGRRNRMRLDWQAMNGILKQQEVVFLSDQSRGELFARPLRQFCIAISLLLLVVSWGHIKAILPVAAVMTGVFAGLTALFQDRRLATVSILSFLIAATGAVPFAQSVLGIPLTIEAYFICPLAAAALLLIASPILDRALGRVPCPAPRLETSVGGAKRCERSPTISWTISCRTASTAATVLLAAAWCIWCLGPFGQSRPQMTALIIAALIPHCVLRGNPWLRVIAAVAANWSLLLAVLQYFSPPGYHVLGFLTTELGSGPWSVAAFASLSLLWWQRTSLRDSEASRIVASIQRVGLRIVIVGFLAATLALPALEPAAIVFTAIAFASLAASEVWSACQNQDELLVWIGEAVILAMIGYFFWFDVISLSRGLSMYVVLGSGILFHIAGTLAARRSSTTILSRPFLQTGKWLPLVTVGIGVGRHFADFGPTIWHGQNSLAILLAGGFYFWQAIERHNKHFAVLSATIVNVALGLLWNELELSDPQFYMVPIGVSVLLLVELLKREIPVAFHNPLRYAGALTILVSPTFHIVSGSWLHMFTLMIGSTLVLLVSIGLRIRALMYAGAAFLIADLLSMVICGGIDRPYVLWIAGLGFGAAIVALGAYCEHHREKLLQRMRVLSVQMQQWE